MEFAGLGEKLRVEAYAPTKLPEPSKDLDIIYPLIEPYAYANIKYDPEIHELVYLVLEPELTRKERENLRKIERALPYKLDADLRELELSDAREYLREKVREVAKSVGVKFVGDQFDRIMYYVERDFIGLGKIEPLMRDPNLEDISCDGVGVPVFVFHRKYGSMRTNVRFETEDELNSFVVKLAQRCGKHITLAEPLLDGSLPDGSRVQLTYGSEVTARGSTFTIRKFRTDPFTPPDLIDLGTISAEMLAYLWLAIEYKSSIAIIGGVASGKTSMLNALSLFIPPELKIVSIEDTREINLPHENWIPSVAREGYGTVENGRKVGEITMFDLLRAALRQRPDYIIVGEIRGREAYTLFQAMATGHLAMWTMHADSIETMIRRLESKPMEIPRVMIANLDLILHQVQARIGNQRVRRTKEMVEILGLDPKTNEIVTKTVFSWDPAEDKFSHHGFGKIIDKVISETGMSEREILEEIENRKKVLEWMRKEGIRYYKDVGRIISLYYKSPEEVLSMIEG